jgi:DNA-directed RNA polymerase subunit RPC12/RpoP
MRNRPTTCAICRQPSEPARIEEVTGAEKELKVTLRGMPVLVCANGHRHFVNPDFPLLLLDHLTELDEPKLPAGAEKGLIVRHFVCSDCGGELQAQPDHEHTFSFDVGLPQIDAFAVGLTTPVYRCSQCGREQVHSLRSLRKLTPAALAHAFKAAQIPHG